MAVRLFGFSWLLVFLSNWPDPRARLAETGAPTTFDHDSMAFISFIPESQSLGQGFRMFSSVRST